ncbi:hypothetical protein KO481_01345 [Nocardia sp. NEAU-G5]|uniref:Uncharacterized protein n=1 Tax=Nocardia albiluteola TaxID=2842303 RepID=A0ABS6AQ75_9NOCA|nr:hypothetical protein [Nocardia albiluteola]MBU3060172.1 hypothetical protein [Nocardia albiluteola]
MGRTDRVRPTVVRGPAGSATPQQQPVARILEPDSDRRPAYEGKYVRFAASRARPNPVQRPRAPILVGAGGSEKIIARIVRSADG